MAGAVGAARCKRLGKLRTVRIILAALDLGEFRRNLPMIRRSKGQSRLSRAAEDGRGAGTRNRTARTRLIVPGLCNPRSRPASCGEQIAWNRLTPVGLFFSRSVGVAMKPPGVML